MSGVNPTPNTEAGVTNDNEESKEVVATSQVFEIDESYFEPDSKQVLRNQMQDLTTPRYQDCKIHMVLQATTAEREFLL